MTSPVPTKVLITDDSNFSRKIIQSCLPSDRQWEVKHASNGVEALQTFKEFRPDLVLLDLTMPEMDGFEALDMLVRLDPNARVVVCTADLHVQARLRVQLSGATAFITKPVTPENLRLVVTAIM